jgi:hypothetical protein
MVRIAALTSFITGTGYQPPGPVFVQAQKGKGCNVIPCSGEFDNRQPGSIGYFCWAETATSRRWDFRVRTRAPTRTSTAFHQAQRFDTARPIPLQACQSLWIK